jgi:hypothetical protein
MPNKTINTPDLLKGLTFGAPGGTTSGGSSNASLASTKNSLLNPNNKNTTFIRDNESNYGTRKQEITIDTLLKRLNPAYRERFRSFFNEFIALNPTGYRFSINDTYRTFKESAELKKQNSENAAPGKSAHNYGLAIDMNLKAPNGETLRKSEGKEKWLATGIVDIAKKYKLGWGGNYASYKDYIHFYVEEWAPNKATKVKEAVNKLYSLGNNPSLSEYIKANPDGLNPKLNINELLS